MYIYYMYICIYNIYIIYVYMYICEYMFIYVYSGTSLMRSPAGLGKNDLNGEVTVLQKVLCTVD